MDKALIDRIRADLNDALRQKKEDKLRTLRFLLAAVNNLIIEKYPPGKGGLPQSGLPDGEVIEVIQRLVKTHRESIEAFQKGGRDDLVQREETELRILQSFLPEQLTEEEIKKMVSQIKARGVSNFGQLMKEIMEMVKGRASGDLVAKIVRGAL
jgi:uncharacterized protein YqeY